MATNAELERVIGKLMSDPNYRVRFAADPKSAARELNVILSDSQAEKAKQFKGSDTALQHMAEQASKDDVQVAWGEER